MRTRVLNHFHTFYPEAQAEHDRLALIERDLTRQLARQPDEDDPLEPPRRMSEPLPSTAGLEAELAQVRADMEVQKAVIASGVVRLVIKGLTRGEFRRLLTEHPPRDGDPLDDRLGYNSDTFGDALVKASILRCEDLDGNVVPNEWDKWADDMTDGQWEETYRACLKLTQDPNPSFPR